MSVSNFVWQGMTDVPTWFHLLVTGSIQLLWLCATDCQPTRGSWDLPECGSGVAPCPNCRVCDLNSVDRTSFV